MERCTAFVLLLAIACVPVLAGADDVLPDPPGPRADAHGRYLSPYAQNDTLTRGLADGGERAGDLRTGVRLARLIGEGDPDRIISRLGQEVTKTVASEAFSRVAGEIGGFSSLLGPIAAHAAGAMDGGARGSISIACATSRIARSTNSTRCSCTPSCTTAPATISSTRSKPS